MQTHVKRNNKTPMMVTAAIVLLTLGSIAPANAQGPTATTPPGTTGQTGPIPGTLDQLNGPWKLVQMGRNGKEGKTLACFFIDNGKAPWDGWKFDLTQKSWKVNFKRNAWATDMLVFDGIEGSALLGTLHPDGFAVRMIPLNLEKFDFPRSVSYFDGIWSYNFNGHTDIAIEIKNGKTRDGRYSLRLNSGKKFLELSEKGVKTRALFVQLEENVWMGMGGSQLPKTLRQNDKQATSPPDVVTRETSKKPADNKPSEASAPDQEKQRAAAEALKKILLTDSWEWRSNTPTDNPAGSIQFHENGTMTGFPWLTNWEAINESTFKLIQFNNPNKYWVLKLSKDRQTAETDTTQGTIKGLKFLKRIVSIPQAR